MTKLNKSLTLKILNEIIQKLFDAINTINLGSQFDCLTIANATCYRSVQP